MVWPEETKKSPVIEVPRPPLFPPWPPFAVILTLYGPPEGTVQFAEVPVWPGTGAETSKTVPGQLLSQVPVTVTVAVQEAKFPAGSVAVSVTGLSPMFEQSNVVLLAASVKLQLSEVPLSNCEAVIVAVPAARDRVMFLQTTMGGLLSLFPWNSKAPMSTVPPL